MLYIIRPPTCYCPTPFEICICKNLKITYKSTFWTGWSYLSIDEFNNIVQMLGLNFDMFKGRQGQGSSGGLYPLPAVEVSPALPVSAVSSAAAAQEKISPHFTQSSWRQTGVALTCSASWGRGGTCEPGATQPKGGVSHLIFQYVEIFIWLIGIKIHQELWHTQSFPLTLNTLYIIVPYILMSYTFARHWPPLGRQAAASDEDKNGPRAFRRTNSWSLISYKL